MTKSNNEAGSERRFKNQGLNIRRNWHSLFGRIKRLSGLLFGREVNKQFITWFDLHFFILHLQLFKLNRYGVSSVVHWWHGTIGLSFVAIRFLLSDYLSPALLCLYSFPEYVLWLQLISDGGNWELKLVVTVALGICIKIDGIFFPQSFKKVLY